LEEKKKKNKEGLCHTASERAKKPTYRRKRYRDPSEAVCFAK